MWCSVVISETRRASIGQQRNVHSGILGIAFPAEHIVLEPPNDWRRSAKMFHPRFTPSKDLNNHFTPERLLRIVCSFDAIWYAIDPTAHAV